MTELNEENRLLSEFYHSLRSPRRQYLIEYLNSVRREKYTTSELAKHISSVERGISMTHATGEPYRNVYNALSQTHLPTLADIKIISYNNDRQIVIHGENFELAALLLYTNKPIVDFFHRR